jgi:hypothetical protein
MGLEAEAGTGAHLGEVLPIPLPQVPPMRLGVPSATQDCICRACCATRYS